MQGERNAVPSRELRKWTGLKTNRDLQMVIAKERAEGKLILSTCRNGGGYFAPSDGALGMAEIRSFIATLNNRAVNCSPFTMAEAKRDVSKMLDEHEEESHSVRERLRKHQQEQTALRKKEKDRDR